MNTTRTLLNFAERCRLAEQCLPDAHYRDLLVQLHDDMLAAIKAGQTENEALRAALAQAADDIESWGAYASDYFQQKHDLQGDIDRARSALKGQP
jgi:hypothetical protein